MYSLVLSNCMYISITLYIFAYNYTVCKMPQLVHASHHNRWGDQDVHNLADWPGEGITSDSFTANSVLPPSKPTQ